LVSKDVLQAACFVEGLRQRELHYNINWNWLVGEIRLFLILMFLKVT
jgi:hypothetical protein